eukprot:TRINITY_DN5162_c0_g1_i1.p1 TRINITY_DN5162_c0_g1~~TRINITY_DN5162_c0_g1_i1.p1  ORF type:complete len:677 (+),score=145.40 TRINITY_DN5162_c0_g1_i1:37-2067(+)
MYDFATFGKVPTIVVQDGGAEVAFVPSLTLPEGFKIDYDLEEDDDEEDMGNVEGNLTQYTLDLLFARTKAQLLLDGNAVPLQEASSEKYWGKVLAISGPLAEKQNERTSAARMRRTKLVAKQLTIAKERWSSWCKQAAAKPTKLAPLHPSEKKPTTVHRAFKSRTPPPIDFSQHATLPLVRVIASDGTEHNFMVNLAFKSERLKGTLTAYNIGTIFKLLGPFRLTTSSGAPVPYNEVENCFEAGLWELLDGPLTLEGTPKTIPADPKQATNKLGQMQAAKTRVLQTLAIAKSEAEATYLSWSKVNAMNAPRTAPAEPAVQAEVKPVVSVASVLRSPPPALQKQAQSHSEKAEEQAPSQRQGHPRTHVDSQDVLALEQEGRGETAPQKAQLPSMKQQSSQNESKQPQVPKVADTKLKAKTPTQFPQVGSQTAKPKAQVKEEAPSVSRVKEQSQMKSRPPPSQATKPPDAQKKVLHGRRTTVQSKASAPMRTTVAQASAASRPSSSSSGSTRVIPKTAKAVPSAKLKKPEVRTSKRKAVEPAVQAPPAPAPAPMDSASAHHSDSTRLDGVGGISRPTALIAPLVSNPETDRAIAREIAQQEREMIGNTDRNIAQELARQEADFASSSDMELARSLAADHDRRTARTTPPPRARPSVYRTGADEDEALARALYASQHDF